MLLPEIIVAKTAQQIDRLINSRFLSRNLTTRDVDDAVGDRQVPRPAGLGALILGPLLPRLLPLAVLGGGVCPGLGTNLQASVVL